MIKPWENDEILHAYKLREKGHTYAQIAKILGRSRNSVASQFHNRAVHGYYKPKKKGKKVYMNRVVKNPPRLHQGCAGVIERQTADKSRITLKAIPSVPELADTPYSYISLDQNSAK